MPSKAKTRAIDLAAGRLAASVFDPQISAAREATAITRGAQEQTRAALNQFYKDSQARYDTPVESKDLDASMELMKANRLSFANNDVAARQDNKLRNFATMYADQLVNRQAQAAGRRELARFREQDLTRDNESYYRNQLRERQSAMDKIVGERGALQAQTYNQMMREQEQRDFQAAEARRAREFQRQQNELARQAQQAQSQRQYDLAVRQLRENKRQFDASLAAKGAGSQPNFADLSGSDQIAAQRLARQIIPALRKYGPNFGTGPQAEQRFQQFLQDQSYRGFNLDTRNPRLRQAYENMGAWAFNYDKDGKKTGLRRGITITPAALYQALRVAGR